VVVVVYAQPGQPGKHLQLVKAPHLMTVVDPEVRCKVLLAEAGAGQRLWLRQLEQMWLALL